MKSNEYTIPESKPLSQTLNAQSIMERHAKSLSVQEKFEKFNHNVKDSMMLESINYLVQKAFPDNVTEQSRSYAKRLCANYVKENDTNTLLRKFKTTSTLLAEMALNIEEACKKVNEKVNPNDELSFTIKPSDKKDFYKGLEDLDFDKVVTKIRERVCGSMEEFVQNNIKDKARMEKLAMATKEKIDAVKNPDEDTANGIKHEYASIYNEKINNTVLSRKKNVYEHMMVLSSKAIIANDELRPSFISESGKLDMDKIGESVDVMYMFLETLNTAKIQKVDEKYLMEIFDSIK